MNTEAQDQSPACAIPPSCVLGAFGLSNITNEPKLEQVFGTFGSIQRINMVRDRRTGESRGYAFIYFDQLADAEVAKEKMNGTVLDGREIRVDFSKTQGPHSSTPGQYLGKHRPDYDLDRSARRDRSRERNRSRSRERYGRTDRYESRSRYESRYESRDRSRSPRTSIRYRSRSPRSSIRYRSRSPRSSTARRSRSPQRTSSAYRTRSPARSRSTRSPSPPRIHSSASRERAHSPSHPPSHAPEPQSP